MNMQNQKNALKRMALIIRILTILFTIGALMTIFQKWLPVTIHFQLGSFLILGCVIFLCFEWRILPPLKEIHGLNKKNSHKQSHNEN